MLGKLLRIELQNALIGCTGSDCGEALAAPERHAGYLRYQYLNTEELSPVVEDDPHAPGFSPSYR